jgi:hypothetical protein
VVNLIVHPIKRTFHKWITDLQHICRGNSLIIQSLWLWDYWIDRKDELNSHSYIWLKGCRYCFTSIGSFNRQVVILKYETIPGVLEISWYLDKKELYGYHWWIPSYIEGEVKFIFTYKRKMSLCHFSLQWLYHLSIGYLCIKCLRNPTRAMQHMRRSKAWRGYLKCWIDN